MPVSTDTTTTHPYDSTVSTNSTTTNSAEVNKIQEPQQTSKASSQKHTKEKVETEETAGEINEEAFKNVMVSESNQVADQQEGTEKGIRNPVSKPNAAAMKETPPASKNNTNDKMKTLFRK
ncbi:MAG: hypothetical protein U0T69_08995 [Chitinophagales bacterium]